ncbi:MAG: hypothetical protein A2287_05465 [Candidatus Melainabacteria bacterium RIFOXYA12_FULL_32_12]|nr:MAG: hypothetical protein A2104_01085 [Candidatus Melainabacteria bacterium GWF2_32_7]OGI17149.1 MAG: hypothetical protein A2255_03875 [Candidatus Melainabacteria bacterium RIFOXYA2_FULL_32_9]OGI31279.1 MAG: hypothetical protein A2287_05465 [Candidatus Melainabacteria bacterium RIFOXYA12_FULL_32_12]
MSDYFCIFAGGGVRGTAYLGVLKALEELNIDITGYAGSSVGAIFAALYAVGYNYEEINNIIFNTPFEIFRDLYIPMGKDFGLCKGEKLYFTLKNLIETKFYGERFNPKGNEPVTFKDIKRDLVIITTNISCTTFKEFSKSTTPDVEIAYAIRASISIPGFFKPVWEDGNCLVDGDIINNFPIWTFSKNLISSTSSRILEFRLEGDRQERKISNLFDYFGAILDTSYNISTDILISTHGQNDQIDIISIDAGKTQVIDFNISNEDKKWLAQSGFICTKKYFEINLTKKKKFMLNIYQQLEKYLDKLKQEVAKDKIKDSQVTLGNLSTFLSENERFIHKKIYDRILKIRKIYLDSMSTIKIINLQFLRNKDTLVPKLERGLKHVKTHIQELETDLYNLTEYNNAEEETLKV